LANPRDVETLRDRLRVGKGTLVDGWLSTADDYFRRVLHVNPLDPLHLDYLRGIDFHRPVTVEPLRPGALLVRFPEIVGGTIQVERPKPYRFFAKPGATPLHLVLLCHLQLLDGAVQALRPECTLSGVRRLLQVSR
jgi:hypothetical protein